MGFESKKVTNWPKGKISLLFGFIIWANFGLEPNLVAIASDYKLKAYKKHKVNYTLEVKK